MIPTYRSQDDAETAMFLPLANAVNRQKKFLDYANHKALSLRMN